MITKENEKIFLKNECYVIVNQNNNIVDFTTFKNNRRKSYLYSISDTIPNDASHFETKEKAEKALSKCKRSGSVKKIIFENTDISNCYNGEGANLLKYDFVNEKIWIQSKDGSKYGYDYRKICMVS